MQNQGFDATLWDVFSEYNVGPDTAWADRLDCLITALVEGTPGWKENSAARQAVIDRVLDLDPVLADKIIRLWDEQVFDAAERGGQIGYALARTWPTDPAGLDTWLDQVREHTAS